MASGVLRKWNVKTGDVVKRGDIIAEVETQKGIIDIEVFESGVIGALLINEDEKVPVGILMTTILPAGSIIEKPEPIRKIKASPLARKIAADLKLDLDKITGTGPDGAITKIDIDQFINKEEKTILKEITPVLETEMRKAIAAAMSRSQQEIPAYVLRTTTDVQPCLTYLHKINAVRNPKDRILLISLLIKVIAIVIKSYPYLNGWWRDGFSPSKEIHIGIVISLRSGGIVVPVIQNANQLTIDQIMKELTELIIRSRSGHLKSSEMITPGITISNLGDAGVESMTGIIYPPQVALIAIGGIKERPWAMQGMLTVRQSVEISLSADHRATDGVYGSRFLNELKRLLSDPEKL